MATEFISNSWLMPENSNQDKLANYSLSFNGTDEDISFASANSGPLNDIGTGDFTVSIWGNATTKADYGALIGNNIGSGGLIMWRVATSNLFQCYIGNDVFTTTYTIPFDDTWHHYLIKRSGTNVTVYVDGVSVATGTSSATLASGSISYIGNQPHNSRRWSGSITEVSIFDYALSASQVTQLYGTGSAVGNPMAITNGRKPVAYYPLSNAGFNGEFLASNGAEQDYVFNVPSSSNIITGNAFSSIITGANKIGICTISYWLSTGTGQQDIIALTDSISTTAGFRIDSSDRPQYLNSQGGRYYRFNAVTDKLDNNFHHWAWVFPSDSVYTSLKLYIDGVEIGFNYDYSLAPANTPWNGFYINKYQNASNANFKISNLSVISSALPATGTESVESLYNYGTPPNIASYSGLQGWWELDASATFDGSNWSVPDASSNSNTGTSSGMTVASLTQSDLIINAPFDPFSLELDGSNDYIDCGDLTSLNNLTAFSTSTWINYSGTPNASTHVFLSGGVSVADRFFIELISSTQIRYGSGSAFDDVTIRSINSGEWHHLVSVHNNTSLDIYLDGVKQNASPITVNAPTSSIGNDFIIGDYTLSKQYEWNGKLSNISIYNSVLTSAQVTTLYNEAKPFDLNTFAVTPVSWWRLGAVNSSFDGTNWTVLDEIGTNNGTSANMTQADLVDGVGATGSGTSSGMSSGTNKTGDAPYSNSNAVSYNMSVTAKSTSVPT